MFVARRITNHSGRKHKNGKVFSSRHADRNYNTKNDPHIDPSLSCKNVYWMNPNLGIKAKTFDQFEQKFYETYFANYIAETNKKHEKSRHYERMTDARKLRSSSRTCVEDTLLYFGDKKNPLPDSEFDLIMSEFVSWHMEKFPQCVVLDYAIHRDEPSSAVHGEMRCVWVSIGEDNILCPNQTKALEQMGIHGNGEKKDNAKKEYTRLCRAKQAEILVSHGYSVELTPNGKGGKNIEELKREKAIEERKEQEKFILHPEDKKEIESQIRPNRFDKDEVIMPKKLAQKLVVSSLERDRYKCEYERERDYKDERIEQEKMGLRIQLNREIEEHNKLKERFKDFNSCVKEFMERRGLMQIFLKAVEQFKQEKEERIRQLQQAQERARQREEERIRHRTR